ncbi:ABC transporter permease [Corynebacterium amycolatum]|uniref:ABC transporter permease n=1 Tax=Corynebacterium amycolatum TaxID=43765 RepID=UPI00191F946F|nr:ABC transporter permease [Corynebacterium amycolatum]QQU97188.1 ABC transporter permease [Corynebacterium amycolatum]
MASSSSTLSRVAWRNITSHKLRLVLTIISVVLGTAFITGAFVFTSSLDKAFKGAMSTAYDGVDVVVTAPADNPGALTKETEQKVENFPGVRALNIGNPNNSITATGADGKPIQTNGSPSLGLPYYPAAEAVGNKVTITEGHAPEAPGEVVVNSTTAELGNLHVGTEIKVATRLERATVKVVGIADTSIDETGYLTVFFTQDQWRELYGADSHMDMFTLAADSTTDAAALTRDIAAAFPELKVEAGSKLADEASERVSSALSFVNYFLIAFGLIGLLVGIFIISNTFTMLVTQRMKEFALLRALGASRRQLTGSVLLEAFIVGLIGSALGVITGFGLSQGLFMLLDAMSISMPGDGLTFEPVAVIVPLIVGVVITMIAAWTPAARAGAVPPVEAMRSGDQTTSNSLSARTWTGAVLASAAIAIIAWALQWNDAETKIRAIFVGVGAVMAVASVWLVGPALSMPLIGGLGRVVGAPFGTVGKLAATNSHRNPRRTGTTSFALTLGLALVTVIGMFGVSMKEAVNEWSETNLTADFVLSPPLTAHSALPLGVEDAVKDIGGVEDTATLSIGALLVIPPEEAATMMTADGEQTEVGPESSNVSVFNSNVGKWYGTRALQGSLDLAMPDAGIVISESTAKKNGWNVDTELAVVSKGGVTRLPVTGIFADTRDPGQSIFVSYEAAHKYVKSSHLLPFQTYVDVSDSIAADSGSLDEMKQKLSDAVADYLVVQVMTVKEFAGLANASIDVMLGIVYALLALAVIISILGIINTVALSVVERRQEIGMLRAVGLQRSGIRRMIRLESVEISIFGAVVGIVLGLFLGWSLLTVLKDEGLNTIAVPWLQVVLMLLGSALVGVIAALGPGQKAAKTPPLAAIADE